MAKSNTITVELDGPKNQAVRFRPLMRNLRGRFDLRRESEPNAGRLHSNWPAPIPGQRLSLDLTTGEGSIVEPLHDTKFAAIREKIESLGQKLPPERESFQGVDVCTWVYWLKSLVESGKAKLIEGELPSKIEGKPQTRFHSTEQPDPIDRLTAAIEKQTELFTKLLSKQAD